MNSADLDMAYLRNRDAHLSHQHIERTRKPKVRQFIVAIRRGQWDGSTVNDRTITVNADAFGVADDDTGASMLIFTDEDGENTAAFRDWCQVTEVLAEPDDDEVTTVEIG